MADELNIVVVAKADETASSKQIAAQLPSIANKIASIDKLELQATIDLKSVDKSIQVAVNKANSLAKSSNQIKFTPTFDTKHMDILKSQLEDFANEMAKLNGFSNSKVSIGYKSKEEYNEFDYAKIQYYNDALKQTVTETYILDKENNKLSLSYKDYADNMLQATKAQKTQEQSLFNLRQSYKKITEETSKNNFFNTELKPNSEESKAWQDLKTNIDNVVDEKDIQKMKNYITLLNNYYSVQSKNLTSKNKDTQSNSINNLGTKSNDLKTQVAQWNTALQNVTKYEVELRQVNAAISALDDDTSTKNIVDRYTEATTAVDNFKNRLKVDTAQDNFDIFNKKIEVAQSGLKQLIVQWDKIKTNQSFYDEYKELEKASQEIKTPKDLTKFNTDVRDYTNRVKAAGLATTKFGTQFKNALSKFGIWLTVGTVLMSAVRAIKNLISEVVKLDSALVDLQMATGGTYEESYNLLLTYNKMAQQLGATTSEVADSANTWLRQGKSIAETNELIEATMVMSKVGMLDSASAAQYLTSALKGYKLSASDALSVVDKLSKVDMMSATDVAGLAEGMSRVATSADLAGVSMDKLIGYIATIGEVTQKDLASVGESLKTVFARMGNVKLGIFEDEDGTDISGEINDVEKILGNVDIKLRDSALEFRDFGDVLDEVAGSWNKFSSVEQSAIANAFAGVRQRENFTVLMSNYDKALNYTEASLNSSGTAMEKFAAYEESITSKLNKLQSAWELLATKTINSDFIKGLIDVATVILQIVDNAGGLIPVLTTIAGLTAIFKAGDIAKFIQNIGLNLKTTFSWLGKFTGGLQVAKVANGGLAVSMKTTTTAAQTMGSTLNSALGVIGLVITAVSLITMGINEYNAAQEQQRQAAIDANKETEEQIKSLSNLYVQYENLSKQTSLTTEQEEDYKTVQKDIIGLLDDRTIALEGLTEGTEEYTNVLKQLTREQLKASIPTAVAGLQASTQNLKNLDTRVSGDNTTSRMQNAMFNEIFGSDEQRFTDMLTYYSTLQSKMSELTNTYDNLIQEGKVAEAEALTQGNAWKFVSNEITNLKDAVDEQISSAVQLALINEQLKNGTPQTVSELNNLKDTIFESTGVNKEFKNTVYSLVEDYFPDLITETPIITDEFSDFITTMQDSTAVLSTYNDELSTLNTNLNDIYDIQESLANGNNLTYEQYLKLSEIEPNITDFFVKTANGYELTVDSLDELRTALYENKKATIKADIETSKSAINNARIRIKAIRDELAAISLLQPNQNYEKFAELSILEQNIEDSSASIKDLEIKLALIEDMGTKSYEALSYSGDIYKDSLNSQKDALDKLIDGLEKQKELREQAKDSIDSLAQMTIDMLKQEKEEEKELYELEKERFKEAIDNRKELLDLAKEESDYNKELSTKQSDISKIQSQITGLSFDDSAETQNKIKTLQEDLIEKQNELTDYQAEHSLDVQKTTLDTEYDNFEKNQDAKIDKIDEYLSNEGQLYQDALNLISTRSKQLYDKLVSWNSVYGTGIKQDVTDAWNNAYKAIDNFGGGLKNVTDIMNNLTTQITNYTSQITNAQTEADKLGDMIDNIPDEKTITLNADTSKLKESLESQIEALKSSKKGVQKSGGDSKAIEYLDTQIEILQSQLDSLPKYHSGTSGVGGTTLKSGETLAKLMKGEMVFNAEQQTNMLKNIASLTGISPNSYTTNNSGSSLTIENINIASTLGIDDTQTVMTEMMSKLAKAMGVNKIKTNALGMG